MLKCIHIRFVCSNGATPSLLESHLGCVYTFGDLHICIKITCNPAVRPRGIHILQFIREGHEDSNLDRYSFLCGHTAVLSLWNERERGGVPCKEILKLCQSKGYRSIKT